MSTDQHTHYSNPTAPHSTRPQYRQQDMMRNTPQYTQQPSMPYYANPMASPYVPQGMIYPGPYPNQPMIPTGGPRMPQPSLIRPPNENANPMYNQQPMHGFQQPFYVQGTIQQGYAPGPYNTYGNPPVYPMNGMSTPATMGMTSAYPQVPPPIQTEQSQSAVSQNPQQLQDKRAKKPLVIRNPESKEVVVVAPAQNTTSTTASGDDQQTKSSDTDLSAAKTKESEENRVREDFRKSVSSRLFSSTPSAEKSKETATKPTSKTTDSASSKPNETGTSSTSDATTENKTSTVAEVKEEANSVPTLPEEKSDLPAAEETSVKSDSIQTPDDNKASTEEPTENASTNPSNDEIQATDSPSTAETSQSQPSSESIEPKPIEKTTSASKRASYTKDELLKKRTDPLSQTRPVGLRYIDNVTKPAGVPHLRESYSNRPSISLEKVDFHNRAPTPYKAADQNRIDLHEKFLREITAILNKLTPQTYDKLVEQLEKLELNSEERLAGMIKIIFMKAVEEKSFCSLYAKLCRHFQRKQVTVPNAEGKMIQYIFRQILLTRCQTEFENDYRQDINYEERRNQVETITDEKERREAQEDLEEQLGKAKRKKLGNIFFIGELFKLQMLTDTIMYDCVEYLLRDKTDEESLECLCRLLRTIGKDLDAKANEKNKANLEKHYRELESISQQRQVSARARFMIQDLFEERRNGWVARRAEVKPLTIDEIHEEERLKREKQEREQERERQMRRDQNRGGNPQQYTDSRGSRGSGMKQQGNRNDDERNEPRFNVNSVRQLQTSDKKQGTATLSFAPQYAWSKGSNANKKPEDDRSTAARTGKPPAMPSQNSKSKTPSSPGAPSYGMNRQSSRELARGNSRNDLESAMDTLRRTTNGTVVTSPNGVPLTQSREGSRNTSRNASRNPSRESSASERVSTSENLSANNKKLTSAMSTDSSTGKATDAGSNTFDEEKTQARVHSLIEEYTENYSDSSTRPVNEALEDLADFVTSNVEHQALAVRELFTNVFEAKPRARKAVGHLLAAAFEKETLTAQGITEGFKLVVEVAPDFAVDIPKLWQYIAEVVGAFVGALPSNLSLLKPLIESIPSSKSSQFFDDVLRFASEFSSKAALQRSWQSSGLSLTDILKSDASALSQYDWLTKDSSTPSPDTNLVKLFKSVNDQTNGPVSKEQILGHIHEKMNKNDKFYIRNIVLSFLEACLVTRDQLKKLQEDTVKSNMSILNEIINDDHQAKIQAVYAIQNFVDKLEHPPKMAQLLFDLFYENDCVSEEAFFDWRDHPDPSEVEGHAVVAVSTKDFFDWLKEAESEEEEKS